MDIIYKLQQEKNQLGAKIDELYKELTFINEEKPYIREDILELLYLQYDGMLNYFYCLNDRLEIYGIEQSYDYFSFQK